MTLTEHLRELRRRVIISAIAILGGTALAFAFHHRLLDVITQPYCDLPAHYRPFTGKCTLVVSGVLDPFTVTLRLSLYAGLLLSSPVWLYQLWRFVTPGLYDKERRWALTFVASSVGLFAAGAVVAYITLQNGLRFLLGFQGGGLASLLNFNSYLSYVVAMMLVFAVSFELPLFIVMLNFAGVLTYDRLRRSTRGIIFGIFAFAALVTPSQDPFTMIALALPMCVLFLGAMLVARVHDRRAAARGDRSAYAHLSDDEISPLDDDEPVVRS